GRVGAAEGGAEEGAAEGRGAPQDAGGLDDDGDRVVLEEVVADLAERLGTADELVGLGDTHRAGPRRVGGDGAGAEQQRRDPPHRETSKAPSNRSLSSSRPACSTTWVPLSWSRSGNFLSLSVRPTVCSCNRSVAVRSDGS